MDNLHSYSQHYAQTQPEEWKFCGTTFSDIITKVECTEGNMPEKVVERLLTILVTHKKIKLVSHCFIFPWVVLGKDKG